MPSDGLSIIAELGSDADLLTYPDEWLESQRVILQQRMSAMADELSGILVAQKIKCQLQQSNLVAVRHVERTNGVPSDMAIAVCPLRDALDRLEIDKADKAVPASLSEDNARQQIWAWTADGYDVEGSRKAKRNRCK